MRQQNDCGSIERRRGNIGGPRGARESLAEIADAPDVGPIFDEGALQQSLRTRPPSARGCQLVPFEVRERDAIGCAARRVAHREQELAVPVLDVVGKDLVKIRFVLFASPTPLPRAPASSRRSHGATSSEKTARATSIGSSIRRGHDASSTVTKSYFA